MLWVTLLLLLLFHLNLAALASRNSICATLQTTNPSKIMISKNIIPMSIIKNVSMLVLALNLSTLLALAFVIAIVHHGSQPVALYN
jgi:hypothetical protein